MTIEQTKQFTSFLKLFNFSENTYSFLSQLNSRHKELKLTDPKNQNAMSKILQAEFQATWFDIASLHESSNSAVMLDINKDKLLEKLQSRIANNIFRNTKKTSDERSFHQDVAREMIEEVFLPMSEIGEKICVALKNSPAL